MKSRRYYQLVLVGLGWFALIGQFILMMTTRKEPVGESILRFFTYFTILTNLLVAICFTTLLVKPGLKPPAFFARPSVQTAVAVYITVVGLVYNTVLRGLVKLDTFGRVLDELLHTVIPVLTIMYWYLWTNGKSLRWSQLFLWLIYPAVYFVVIILRGHVSGFYPYPFVNVDKFGIEVVAMNSAGVVVVFVLTSLLYIWIGRNKSHRDVYLV